MQASFSSFSPMDSLYYQPVLNDPFLVQQDAQQNFATGFSRGSSYQYPHQEYRYFLDRGELSSRLCSTSLVDANNTVDATGLGFSGDPSSDNFVPPEDISVYSQQTWWQDQLNSDISAPLPVYAPPDFFDIKNSTNQESALRYPAAQLPTPAAMAVLLNSNSRSEGEPSQRGHEIPPGSSVSSSHSSATSRTSRPVEPAVATQQSVPESLSREKKHACTMCHKRFDRPSTLRKHLLVHTGEKAFVCETCGRRFGVASNLNRHVKRCILKPVNTPSPSNISTSGSPTITGSPENSILIPTVISMTSRESNGHPSRTAKRNRGTSSVAITSPSSDQASTLSAATTPASSADKPSTKPAGQKRRRRAPSPSQWIPATLQNFNLLSEDSYRVTSVPLAPVKRNPPKEERDSWDENVAHAPYHPCGWSGVLPGPGFPHVGLGGKDVRGLNLGARGGFMMGRVLVF